MLVTRNQNLAAVGVLIAVAAATVIWLQLRSHPDAPAVSVTAPTAASGELVPRTTPVAPVAKPRVRRLDNPAERGELLRQIRKVHATRSAPVFSSTTTLETPALPPPEAIEKEYIRSSVRELIPLLVECYEEGLARDPKLGGSLVVDFTIEGEPGVGGVVGESAIDAAGSTLTDPAVSECVQETMFAIEIEPPAGGGVVQVRYPFEFRSAPE